MTQPPFNPPEQPQAPYQPPAPEQPQVPYAPQTPQAEPAYQPQAPQYAPQAAYAAAPQTPYMAPQQPYMVPQQPAPKKKKTGMVVAIILIVVAVVATGGYFGFKAVVGNKLTPYCRTFISVGSQMEDLSDQMNSAGASGDLNEMSEVMGEMIALFDQLRNSSPPDTVSPSLDTVYDYLTTIKGFIDSKDLVGYINYMSSSSSVDFATAATTVDEASVAYCNG